jgi:hypothetical protein
MRRIALLQCEDSVHIQVWLPIDFTFGRRGTITGEELGFVTDAKRRYKFVQWMPYSML